MKRVSVRFRGTHKRARPGPNYSFVVHDFRFYAELGMNLPSYIVPDRIKDNRIVFLSPDLQGREDSYYEIVEVLQELEVKQKEDLKVLHERGHSVPHTFKNTFAQIIITFSAETRKAILDGEISVDDVSGRALDFFLAFSKVFGVKPLYLVLHLDETSPHFHGLVTNARTYDLNSNPLDDPEILYLTETYLPGEKEKIYLGVGKTLTGSIKDTKRYKEPPYYVVDIRKVQDFVGKIFAPMGIFRGISREERMNAGQPFWKWLHRSVNRLHYDLPMEIKLKEEELVKVQSQLTVALSTLKETVETLKTLKSEKKKLEEEIERLQKLLRMKEEEFYKFLEEEKKKALLSLEEELAKKNKELSKVKEDLKKSIKYAEKTKKLFKAVYDKMKLSQEKTKKAEEDYNELLSQIEEAKRELQFLTEMKNKSEDELQLYSLSLKLINNPEDEESFKLLTKNPLFHISELLSTYHKLYHKYLNEKDPNQKQQLLSHLLSYQKLLKSKLQPYEKVLMKHH